MNYNIRHALKRLFVRYKLYPNFQNIYWTFSSLFKKNEVRQEDMLIFYSKFIDKGDLCFDIGANRGDKTAVFLKIGTRVVAVEPQESCVKYLKKRFKGESNFTIVEKGLADKEGEIVMSICEEANSISTLSEKWKTGRFSKYKWTEKKLIPVTTMDNLIKKFGLPVFCKIDVEGFECQVLKGLSQPIKYLSFEFTKEFFNDAKACIDYLNALEYTKFNCSIDEAASLRFPMWLTAENLLEKLSSVKDDLLWGDIYAKY